MQSMLLWMLLAAPTLGAPVERVVAVVEERLVLLSDVRAEDALYRLRPEGSLLWTRHPDDPERRALEAAMLRTLAGDVGLYRPEDTEVESRLGQLRQAAGSALEWESLLAELGLDATGMRAQVQRRLIAEAYAQRNVHARAEDDPSAWMRRADELMLEVAERLRVRRIEPQTPP